MVVNSESEYVLYMISLRVTFLLLKFVDNLSCYQKEILHNTFQVTGQVKQASGGFPLQVSHIE